MTLRIGLTGGIGSGKSTVLQMLVQLGAAPIDADAISRGTTAPGGAAISLIAQRFGAEFIAADGALDRDRMRERIYVDNQARKQLEDIIHPLVGQEAKKQADAARAAGSRCIVFDIPLLVESGGRWRSQLDAVLVIDCSPETQVARVGSRSGLSDDEIRSIIAAQAQREARLAAADMIICNEDLSLGELQLEVAQAGRRFGL